MKISICMAYYNRKQLLLNTLASIKSTVDHEIIVVDDGSNEDQRLEDIDNIKLIRVEKDNKTWVNSCIPYNMAFKQCTGDVVIIQNPECEHCGDILSHAVNSITESNYLTYSCYSLPENNDRTIYNRTITFDGQSGWYNHPIYRPTCYHFCSAITRKNLEELGGFDERYANGIDYDDNEFLTRVHRKGLMVGIVESPFVFHQWHYVSGYRSGGSNKNLFNKTLTEKYINPNKEIR